MGEAADKPLLRRIAGPLLMVLIAAIAYGVASLGTSFDSSMQFSGATKEFVSALIATIDRGDVDAAHSELRRFDDVSIQTYEGGAFLRWLSESTTRLSSDAMADGGHAPSSNGASTDIVSEDSGEQPD